jgi:hypothetical protein
MKTKRLAISLLKPGHGQGLRAGRLSGSGTGKRTLLCRTRAFGRDESGAVAIVTAILMVVFLGFLSLAVDIGHLATVKNELQNAADAAALAGARALVFEEGTMVQKIMPLPDPPYCNQAVTWAQNTINKSDAQNLSITVVQTGVWDWPANTFTPSGICQAGINAVHVEVQRNDSANQPVATWFARIFGIDTVNAAARATAAVGTVEDLPPGTGFPIAINQEWLDDLADRAAKLRLNPDGVDNSGWCSPMDIGKPSGQQEKQWMTNGYPDWINLWDPIYLNNGTIDSALQALAQSLPSNSQSYDVNGTTVDGWEVVCPVVQVDKFTGAADVVALQTIIITDVDSKGNPKTIGIYLVDGPILIGGSSSGGNVSNLYATQPKLVQ